MAPVKSPLRTVLVATLVVAAVGCGSRGPSAERRPAQPQSVRVYVFDGGTLRVPDPSRFQLRKEEIAESDLAVSCFLIAHPKGTLLWDTCAVPDGEWTPTSSPVTHHMVLADSQEREVTIRKSLRSQLAEAGYSPENISYIVLSHYHYDHTANANQFAQATWLVRGTERDAMFADPPPGVTRPSTYAALRTSKTVLIDSDEHDVFGDGTVIIKAAPGHTQGHQILYLKLTKTGAIVLSGDLYHYQEERTLDRVPTFEFNAEQTRTARVTIERFLREKGAQLWIQHDLRASAQLKKAPDFYD